MGVLAIDGRVLGGISYSGSVVAATFSKGHRHAAYQVGVLAGGVGHAFYRGAHWTLGDELIVFESGEPHAGRLVSPSGWLRRTFLTIEPHALERVASEVAGRAVSLPHFPEPSAPGLGPHFVRLFADLHQGTTLLAAEEKTVDALALLIGRCADVKLTLPRAGAEPRAVLEARAYLEAHLAESVSLARLGEVTQMNWDYLRRVFRRHVGVSPHRYQVLLRLEQAKRLVWQGVPLGHAALAVGFADQAHLTRAFRSYFGVSPGRLKTKVQNVQENL